MVDREMLSAIADLLDEKLDKKLEPIYERLDRIEGDVVELKTEVVELKADVAELKERAARLETDVAELKTYVAELKTDVAELKMDVAELKTDLAELKTDVAELKERTARLEGDVAELKETTARLNEDMKRVKITLEHSVLPRLNTIEGCYLETSKRYLESADQIDDMYADIDVLKYTVRKHSEKLQRGRRAHRATSRTKTNIAKEDESV